MPILLPMYIETAVKAKASIHAALQPAKFSCETTLPILMRCFTTYNKLGDDKMRKLNLALATVLGVSLPLCETVRRWGTDFFLPMFLDDYLMGGMLLFGAWCTYKNTKELSFLLVAWAFTCGMLYLSFFGNLDRYLNQSQSAGISSAFWVSLILLAFVSAILGLALTLWENRRLNGKIG